MRKLSVDPDIRRARTLPPEIYSDPVLYDLQRDRVMRRGWQVVADAASLREPGQARPVTLLEGCLDEPLLLTRDGGGGPARELGEALETLRWKHRLVGRRRVGHSMTDEQMREAFQFLRGR